MPFVDVKTPTGVVNYNYTISTPYSSDADSISPGLPTLLFFHPVYCGIQTIFHSQFSDPRLRRFNLVAFDLRGHGETTGPKVPPTYNEEDAATDAALFMDALKLPPCHILGMSSGTTIALQCAISYPEKVLSVFLISQLCLEEPPEVAEGHQEIYDRHASGFPDALTVDESLVHEAIFGTIEYAFGTSAVSDLAEAYVKLVTPVIIKTWGFQNLDACKTMVTDFLSKRKAHSKFELSRIKCPIQVVYGTNDVAYPPEYTDEFVQSLEDAGVNVALTKVPDAPHFLCVDYGHVINPIMHDLVVELYSKNPRNSVPLPPIMDEAISPWDTVLREAGWRGGSDGYDSDDDLIFN
ncbi:hypothetical protein V5O48_012418 [Marasmius crinis-equi]|uniref:AB hydrolase-1 domain-containing protein n=1 Tax=Marasmius crinis-equi TaxID=585013 RepID=A0ABR3F2X2_9AGAR